mmetsp:Transcript_51762/g.128803  ORF Transcript_51762/g.128803 Transcript_51762/m.128803 type:complete len:213 (-) Transcript_51762:312-950(-)
MHTLAAGPAFLSCCTRLGWLSMGLPDTTFSLMPFSGLARRTTRITLPLEFLCTVTRCSCAVRVLRLFILFSYCCLPAVFVCTGSPRASNFFFMPGSKSACAALRDVKSTEVNLGLTIESPAYGPPGSLLSSFPVLSLYQACSLRPSVWFEIFDSGAKVGNSSRKVDTMVENRTLPCPGRSSASLNAEKATASWLSLSPAAAFFFLDQSPSFR